MCRTSRRSRDHDDGDLEALGQHAVHGVQRGGQQPHNLAWGRRKMREGASSSRLSARASVLQELELLLELVPLAMHTLMQHML